MENILREADRITSGDRRQEYGSAMKQCSNAARMWSVILGKEVTPQQVALCMVALKITREMNQHKPDNLVDIAGYARVLEMIYDDLDENYDPRDYDELFAPPAKCVMDTGCQSPATRAHEGTVMCANHYSCLMADLKREAVAKACGEPIVDPPAHIGPLPPCMCTDCDDHYQKMGE